MPTAFKIIAASLMFIYIFWRAAAVPVTHDEAFTINHHVPRSWPVIAGIRIELMEEFANHHVLNTALIKLIYKYCNQDEFAARLPNAAAGVLGIASLYYIVFLMNFRGWESGFAFVFAAFSPLLSEFYGLARGYGLSTGLFLAGFALWLSIPRSDNLPSGYRGVSKLSAAAFLFALSLAANLSIVFAVAGTTLSEILLFFLPRILKEYRNKNSIIKTALSSAVMYFPAAAPGLILLWIVYGKTLPLAFQYGAFYVQNRDGLLTGTLPGLFSDWGFPVFGEISAAFLLLMLIPAVYRKLKKFRSEANTSDIVFKSFAVIFATPVFLDILLKTGYPSGRTAVYLYPLISLTALSLIKEDVTETIRINQIRRSSVFTGAAAVLIAGLLSLNLSRTTYWKYDADSREIFYFLQSIAKKEKRETHYKVHGDWILEPSFNFYRNQAAAREFLPFERGAPLESGADFYLLTEETRRANGQDISRLKLLKTFPESGVSVYRKISE